MFFTDSMGFITMFNQHLGNMCLSFFPTIVSKSKLFMEFWPPLQIAEKKMRFPGAKNSPLKTQEFSAQRKNRAYVKKKLVERVARCWCPENVPKGNMTKGTSEDTSDPWDLASNKDLDTWPDISKLSGATKKAIKAAEQFTLWDLFETRDWRDQEREDRRRWSGLWTSPIGSQLGWW